MYKRPSYDIKTTGVFTFKTKDKEYLLKSYHFERENDTEDMLQIQDELRGEIGGVRIKNSAWNKLAKGQTIIAKTSKAKGDISGRLTRIDDINNSDKYEKGGNMNEYSKGGNVIERRYVNKDEDYEVRYAKNRPSRMGYKDERMFAKGGEISDLGFAYLADLWFAVQQRDTDDYEKLAKYLDEEGISHRIQNEVSADATELRGRKSLSISEVHDRIKNILARKFAVGGGIDGDEAIETYIQYKSVILERVGNNIYLTINGKTWKLTKSQLNELLEDLEEYSNPLTASEFLMDTDKSKYENITSNKFAVGGEIGNTVSFKGDYGTPRSGVVKEKRGSSYIVATDDGDRLVDSYEVISFSETPIAKKKRFGFFAGGGEIENKIEKLKKVVSSKMLPESVKAKAQAEIDKLEKELHESKETKAEEKEEHKAGGSEARLDEKEELNATIQKLYDIEAKAEDLINYQSGGIQGQSVDKIKKYVEYVNKEVSKLDVPFGSEVFEVLEDENAHSLNLTLGLLGFYKNAKDSGEWAKKHEQYAKVVEVVNEIKGGGKPEAKEPKFKIGDVVGLDLDEATPKKITSFKTNRKGEIIYSGYYIPFPNEKWNYEESEIVLLKTPSKPEAKKPTTTSKKEVVGYAIVDPISGEIVVSKKTIRQLIEASKKLEKTKGFEDMGDLAYEIIKKDDKNVLGDKIESVDIKSLPIGKKAPVKKAVVKKAEPKSEFEIGDKVTVKGETHEIKEKKYIDYLGGGMTWAYKIPTFSFYVRESDVEAYKKPKADHKKLVAKLKAKKGATPSNAPSKGHKRSEASDRKRSALPLGKRVSADGNIYYERRLNRADISKEDKFEKGGEVDKNSSSWGLNLNW